MPFVASEIKTVVALPDQLNLYRRHPDQVSGVRRLTIWDRLFHSKSILMEDLSCQVVRWQEALERLSKDTKPLTDGSVLHDIEGLIGHLAARSQNLTLLNRVGLTFKELISGRYARYSNGWKSFAKDLFS